MERRAVGPRGLTSDGLARMRDVMAGHVEEGGVPGLAWLVAQGDSLHAGTAGTLDLERGNEVQPDSIFRISSMTKPVTAVAALVLIEECRLRLDDPVDALLPELAERRVLARPDATLDDTVPATTPDHGAGRARRFGSATAWTSRPEGPQPVLSAMAELGLGSGVPAPAVPPPPDEWIRRLGTLPLAHQPGRALAVPHRCRRARRARGAGRGPDLRRLRARADLRAPGHGRHRVLRAGGQPRSLRSLLRARPHRRADPFDPAEGQWSQPPAFPSGADGLVSTLRDFPAFAQMLLAEGTLGGARILSAPRSRR